MIDIIYAISLGIIQGITEWIPVSSEAIIAIFYAWFFEQPVDTAITFALWLHAGTGIAATIVFREKISLILKELRKNPTHLSSTMRFLITSTFISSALGLFMITIVRTIPSDLISSMMLLVGATLSLVGIFQIKKKSPALNYRYQEELKLKDGLLVGIAQGLSVIPGISRSGSTISTLLFLRLEKKQALELSFLLSIPASLSVAIFNSFSLPAFSITTALISFISALLTGIFTMRFFLKLTQEINFGLFAIGLGILIILGSVIELLFL
jgi:undecaprenyl-diphosphatase